MTANIEYRKAAPCLSLLNSQLAQQNESIFLWVYRGHHAKKLRSPPGLMRVVKRNNDVKLLKLDFSLQDNKTLIYRADVQAAEVSSGQ